MLLSLSGWIGQEGFAQDRPAVMYGPNRVCPGETASYTADFGCDKPIRISWNISGGEFVGETANRRSVTVIWNGTQASMSISANQHFDMVGEGCNENTGAYPAMGVSWIIPPSAQLPRPAAPVISGNLDVSNNACENSAVTISAATGASPYSMDFLWEISTNDGASYSAYTGAPNASSFSYTIPALGTARTVRFRVKTRFTACQIVESPWVNSGPMYINPAPPTVTFLDADPAICTDNPSVQLNITGGDANTEYLFSYDNQTVANNEGPNVVLRGPGIHTVPLTYVPRAGTLPHSFQYGLAFKAVDAEGNPVASSACEATGTFVITDGSYSLGLDLAPRNERCHNTGDGGITLTHTNGAEPYTYTWTRPASTTTWATKDLTNVPGGVTYTVVARDAHGCTGTDSETVVKPAELRINSAYMVPNAAGFGVSCHADNLGGVRNDGRITVEAEGGTGDRRFDLTGLVRNALNQPSATITALYPDTYTVVVRDANRCEYEYAQPVAVTSPDPLTHTRIAKTDLTCANVARGEVALTGVAGGTGDYMYSLNGGTYQPSASFQNLLSGSYTITVRDGSGCTQQDTATLRQPALMVVGLAGSTPQSCTEIRDGVIGLGPGKGGTGKRMYSIDGSRYVPEADTVLFEGLASGGYTVYIRDDNACVVTRNYPLDIRPVITGPISETEVISCHGERDGALRVTADGGTAPYTYTWSTGGTDPAIVNLAADTFTVTIRDSKRCEKTFTHILRQPGVLTARAAVADYAGYGVRCNGSVDGAIDITMSGGTPPFAYTWSNQATTKDVKGLAPGVYSVTVVDGHGCKTDADDLRVTEPAVIGLAVGEAKNISCKDGSDGEVLLSATGGAAGYRYSLDGTTWLEEDRFTGLTAGPYIVRVRDSNGCTTLTDTTLTEPDKLLLGPISKVETTCGEANGKAEVLASGGAGGYFYTWHDRSGSIVEYGAAADSLRSGTYQVVVRDRNACETPLEVVMRDSDGPRVTLEDTVGLTCFESNDGVIRISVNHGQAPYRLVWDIPGETGLIVEDVTGGKHWVEVYDARGCWSKEDFDVSTPTKIEIAETLTEPSCRGTADGSIVISASGGNPGGYQYNWDHGVSGTVLENLGAGTYTVTVTDVRDCKGVKEIEVIDPAQFVVDAGGDRTICVGQKAVIRAQEDGTYTWTSSVGFTSEEREVVLTVPGTYSLKVVSPRGCEASDTFILQTSTDLLKADFLMASEAAVGDTVVVVDISWPVPEGLRWTLPEAAAMVRAEDVYGEMVFSQPGEYDIILNTFLGECIADLTKHIVILEGEAPDEAGRQPSSLIEQFEVYPNPSDGRFTIAVTLRDENTVGYMQMISVSGERRLLDVEVRGTDEYYYQDKVLPAGIYFVVVKAGSEKKWKRIVVK